MPDGCNVAKLTDAPTTAARDGSRVSRTDERLADLGMVMAFAEHLAARRVLVPSALPTTSCSLRGGPGDKGISR